MFPAFRSNRNRALHPSWVFINQVCGYSCENVNLERFRLDRLPVLIQSCTKSPSLQSTKALHAVFITTSSHRHYPSIFLYNNLISAYAASGELRSARDLFEQMSERTAVSFNSIISAYSHLEQMHEVFKLFLRMIRSGFRPTSFTFGSILRSAPLEWGIQLQPLILKSGLLCSDAFTGTALVGMYVRQGWLVDAMKMFEEMPQKNIVTWNSIIIAFSQHGIVDDSMILFRQLLRFGLRPSDYSFVGVLSGFKSTEYFNSGVQVHALVVQSGMDCYCVVANSLIDMYGKFHCAKAAERIFNEMPFRDVISWNSIMAAVSQSERPERALELFLEMSSLGFIPTQASFASVLVSCTSTQDVNCGKFIHGKAIKRNLKSDYLVGSALVGFYVKSDRLGCAHCLFDEIKDKSTVLWNTLMSGYTTKNSTKALHLLKEMLNSGVRPNEFSFSSILKVLSAPEIQQLHSLITKLGYDQDNFVSSSFISSCVNSGRFSEALTFASGLTPPLSVVQSNLIAGMHSRTGQYQETISFLSQLKKPDIVSWNCLIEAYARTACYQEAFDLFKQMRINLLLPDNCTFVSLLSICSELLNVALGGSLHALMIKLDFNCCDVFVKNVLVDMYAKCGNLDASAKVFTEMKDRNIISWTALISSLGLHGCSQEAVKKFNEMEMSGLLPDRVAFSAVLSACRHGGLVNDGIRLFENMDKIYRIEPEMDHYASVVDMLCRNGYLKEAEQVICSMPFHPNALIWRSFCEACKRYGNVHSHKTDDNPSVTTEVICH